MYASIRYFDLYPNGFLIDNKEEIQEWKPGERFISIYLHSSRRQVGIFVCEYVCKQKHRWCTRDASAADTNALEWGFAHALHSILCFST